MPPLASIDIGSNTIRLLIGDVVDGSIHPLHYDQCITRLAGGIDKTGRLQEPNIAESLKVLNGFIEKARSYNVKYIYAVGTSALREAVNSDEFITRASSELGLQIEVLEGVREAELTSRGVSSSMAHATSALIIDIGGGSTEWIASSNGDILKWGSIPVGVVKLHDRHIRFDPPSKSELNNLNTDIGNYINILKRDAGAVIDEKTVLICTAGTATTLASIDLRLEHYDRLKVHGHKISLERLKAMATKLSKLSFRERSKVRGLEPGREDLIIPGIYFTINILDSFGFKQIVVSDSGLLEGIILRLSEGGSILAF